MKIGIVGRTRRTISVVAGFLSFLIFTAPFLTAKTVDKTIAVVNNEPIMLSELENIARPILDNYKKLSPGFDEEEEKKLKKRLMDEMIDQRLLSQEAKKQRVAVTKRELENGIEQIKKRFRSEAEFQAEIKNQGLSIKNFEEKIKQQLTVIRLIETEVKSKIEKPSEKEAMELFERIKIYDPGKTPTDINKMSDEERDIEMIARLIKRESQEKVRARHILIMVAKDAAPKEKLEALSRIKDVRKKIKDSKSFSEMARLYSEDPGSKDNGGDLGYFVRGDMVPEFEKVAFGIEVGKVSEPVLTDFGYHLIFVEERRVGKDLGYEDVKNDLLDYLTQKNATKKYEEYLATLRKKSNIKINPF